MATERKQSTTQRRAAYRTNGAAAYDVRYQPYQYGTEAPVRQPAGKPRKKAAPRKRPKAKLAVAPLAVVGMLVAGLMLLLVVCGYIELYEATNQVSDLQDQIDTLQERNDRLQSSYDEKIDLTAVEQAAAELGMHAPNSKQTVYLNLSGRDKAEIMTAEETGLFGTILEALRSTGQRMIEYFR